MNFYGKSDFEQLANEFTHEVKNPVALIQANIDYIRTGDKSGLYEKNYGIIKKELQKIINVVKDFAVSVSPVSDYAVEKELIFIYDLITDITEEFITPLDGKKVSFDINCEDEDVKILGEYSKICIIFFNIFKNAIEAMNEDGEIKVSIKNENKEVVIKVSDSGSGIDKSFLELVGNPFFTTKANGSGLGLPICKRIAEDHGGSFNIYNNEKQGCTAEVRFKAVLE